jgi:GTP-sensing pleiotropic transcriptional regulator CodY
MTPLKVCKHGACTLTRDAIADLSTITRRVVMTALRTAKAEGLIEVERPGGRSNTITVSPTWRAWLDRYGDAPDEPR